MKKTAEYHEHAHQCRILAASSSNREHREMLSRMAETWESLARNREVRLARQQRISDLDSGDNAKGDVLTLR